MPERHRDPTISFRANPWAKALIEQRAALSGIYKKDFIIRSCIYSNIVVVGKKENIQRIVDSLQEMQIVMREIAGQIQSGSFSLSEKSFEELKRDYLALVMTIVEIVDGAAYLFSKEPPVMRKNWKAELEQYHRVLEVDTERADAIEKEAQS